MVTSFADHASGILLAFKIGGQLFDSYGPWAPFVMVGVLQLVLCVLAIGIRVMAPGALGDSPSEKLSAGATAAVESE